MQLKREEARLSTIRQAIDLLLPYLMMIMAVLALVALPVLIVAISILALLAFVVVKCFAEAGDTSSDKQHEEPNQRVREKAERIAAFNTGWERAKALPAAQTTDEAIERFFAAKRKIIDSTSEFADDRPGEGKSLLRTAIGYVENEGEFGQELGRLIDVVITHSYSCDDTASRSDFHKMIWDCARLITLRFGNEKSPALEYS